MLTECRHSLTGKFSKKHVAYPVTGVEAQCACHLYIKELLALRTILIAHWPRHIIERPSQTKLQC